MSIQGEILPQTRDQLLRPATGQVRFSDVFPEVVGQQEEIWWRKTDFDAKLTDEVESSGFPKAEQIPIGFRPWFANYGLILVDDLVRAQNDRVLGQRAYDISEPHPDVKREIFENAGAVLALANYAPRDEENTANGANGSDFYLAITDSGLEIYATPLTFLSSLEARHRITALYRIPTHGHPEFDGDHEQFRSARVIRSRRHPGHLVPIFEYESRKEVIEAKQAETHPLVIPRDRRIGHLGHIDKFGNLRGEVADTRFLQKLRVGRLATLVITNLGNSYEFGVQVAEDLHSSPLGRLAVYANCSDYTDSGSYTGYVELVARVAGNPSTSEETAIFQILNKVPDLDPATAELQLVA